MPDEPLRLKLDQGPAKVIKTAVTVLSKWISLKSIRLGGGTVLEARWHHRKSTDLAFVAIRDEVDELFYARYDMVYENLVGLRERRVISESGIRITGRNVIHFVIGETPISLERTDRFHSDPCDDVEEETGVFLNSPRDILTKKLIDRHCYGQIATDRDAYDFVIARSFAFEDLEYGWNLMDHVEKSRVIDLCQYRIDRTMNQESHSRELSDVSYPHLQNELWDHVKHLFESNLKHKPPLDI